LETSRPLQSPKAAASQLQVASCVLRGLKFTSTFEIWSQHMKNISQSFKSFWSDEEGASAIEYGLLASLIALAITGGATLLGGALNTLFTDIAGQL
jgi:pilus assembly protein Flp/PilA